jgi:hypothetical protein
MSRARRNGCEASVRTRNHIRSAIGPWSASIDHLQWADEWADFEPKGETSASPFQGGRLRRHVVSFPSTPTIPSEKVRRVLMLADPLAVLVGALLALAVQAVFQPQSPDVALAQWLAAVGVANGGSADVTIVAVPNTPGAESITASVSSTATDADRSGRTDR